MAATPATAKTGVAKEGELQPYQELVKRLNTKAEATEMFAREDAWEFAKQAVNRITQAETADDLFEASEKSAGLQSMGDDWIHINNPIILVEVNFRKGEERYREGTLGVYAVVNYALPTGESFVVGCGAPNVVAFLEKWETLPKEEKDKASHVRVVSKPTGRGDLLRVVRA